MIARDQSELKPWSAESVCKDLQGPTSVFFYTHRALSSLKVWVQLVRKKLVPAEAHIHFNESGLSD
jgi:hypothetical protein